MVVFKQVLLCGAAVLLLLPGCSKKEDSANPVKDAPGSTPAVRKSALPAASHPETIHSPEPSPAVSQSAFDQLVELWENGHREQAERAFLAMDWTAPDVFAAGSFFGMSEAEFAALPQSERTQIGHQATETAAHLREMAKYMVEQAKQKPAAMDTYRTSLTAFAGRLAGEDQLLLIRSVGKAVAKFVEKELAAVN
jgi:hypothetical protein